MVGGWGGVEWEQNFYEGKCQKKKNNAKRKAKKKLRAEGRVV